MSSIKWTFKQISIVKAIKAGCKDGSCVSVYDLMENLPYEAKRDAILHSIKILSDNGYVVRGGTKRIAGKKKPVTVFRITTKALEII